MFLGRRPDAPRRLETDADARSPPLDTKKLERRDGFCIEVEEEN